MKKIIMTSIICLYILTGCGNKQIFDTTYTFNYISCNETYAPFKNTKIKKWTDYDDGEQLQVTLEDGNIILISANYCWLSQNPVE